jgi:hypothetical protein
MSGAAYPGHRVLISSGTWCTITDRLREADGCVEVPLQPYPFGNTWGVYVVDGDSPRAEGDCGSVLPQIIKQLSEAVSVNTTFDNACCKGSPVPGDDCSGSQWVHLTFQEK